MTELNMYETMVALMGEPTSFTGIILLYVLTFLFVVFIGTGGFVLVFSLIRVLTRR